MEHSFWDKYSNLSSPIHALNAKFKFACAIGFILLINLMPRIHYTHFIAALLAISVIVLVSRVPVSYVLGRSFVVIPFILFIGVANFLAGAYDFNLLLNILGKSYLSVIIIIIFTATTRFSEVIKVLEFFRFPRMVVILISFLYRYFFILIDEIYRKHNALVLRREKINARFLAVALAEIFIRSYYRSERIYYAMKLRGYNFD